jgi:hypothetical protein
MRCVVAVVVNVLLPVGGDEHRREKVKSVLASRP